MSKQQTIIGILHHATPHPNAKAFLVKAFYYATLANDRGTAIFIADLLAEFDPQAAVDSWWR